MKPEAVSGFVLAGGGSRRMGSDKALLPWNGGTLLSRAVDSLRPLCSSVAILSSDPRHELPGLKRIPDIVPEKGPLAALLSGLKASETDWNLFLACDIPLLPQKALEYLLDAIEEGHQAVLFRENDRLQPLCAAYHRSIIPALEKALAEESLGLIKFVSGLMLERIDANANLAFWSPEMFANANRPEDLERIRKLPDQ